MLTPAGAHALQLLGLRLTGLTHMSVHFIVFAIAALPLGKFSMRYDKCQVTTSGPAIHWHVTLSFFVTHTQRGPGLYTLTSRFAVK